jgi:hypothetical protein
MAFSTEITQRAMAMGNKRMSMGTFSCSGATGGDVDTGLRSCEHLAITLIGSAVVANAPVVDETFPLAGSAVTIVTDSGAVGNWVAWGY